MVKLDAADREASGKPLASEVNVYLSQLAASVVDADTITDLYAEAGLGNLDITNLNGEHLRELQNTETPHLTAEALRRLIEQKMREATRHNIIRRESFAEKLEDLMIRSSPDPRKSLWLPRRSDAKLVPRSELATPMNNDGCVFRHGSAHSIKVSFLRLRPILGRSGSGIDDAQATGRGRVDAA